MINSGYVNKITNKIIIINGNGILFVFVSLYSLINGAAISISINIPNVIYEQMQKVISR